MAPWSSHFHTLHGFDGVGAKVWTCAAHSQPEQGNAGPHVLYGVVVHPAVGGRDRSLSCKARWRLAANGASVEHFSRGAVCCRVHGRRSSGPGNGARPRARNLSDHDDWMGFGAWSGAPWRRAAHSTVWCAPIFLSRLISNRGRSAPAAI